MGMLDGWVSMSGDGHGEHGTGMHGERNKVWRYAWEYEGWSYMHVSMRVNRKWVVNTVVRER